MKFYITPGSGQPYYPGYFVCIADDVIMACNLATTVLNSRWCGIYESLDKIHPFDRIQRGYITKQYGLTETQKNQGEHNGT